MRLLSFVLKRAALPSETRGDAFFPLFLSAEELLLLLKKAVVGVGTL